MPDHERPEVREKAEELLELREDADDSRTVRVITVIRSYDVQPPN
jgi:hypothetical protein